MAKTRSPDSPGMEQRPRKRYGALIFTLVFIAIAGGIIATVLLANDSRNLRLALRQFGYEERTMVIPKQGALEAFKGKRIDGAAVQIPGQMFVAPTLDRDSAFLRSLDNKDGEGLCVLLRKKGFDMTPWEGGAFATSVLECSYENKVANPKKPDDPSTFFIMIKGNAAGDLLSARAKVVISSFDAQAELAKRTADALQAFAAHTNWLDLEAELPKVARLESFTIASHGVTVKFQKEFSANGGYNLILAASAPLTPAQRRTRDYFNRALYWTMLPEHGGRQAPARPEPVEEDPTKDQ
jgi:hypothetical protein